jgi:hypothetical protein
MALDLAAGRLRNTAGLEQHDRADRQVEISGNAPANGSDDAIEIETAVAFNFLDDHQTLGAGIADGEGGAGALLHVGMREVNRALDVLRVVVDAADDDQVFEASSDKQLAL